MLRLASDENFNGAMVRGLGRLQADYDVVRVQDVGLSGASDPEILRWAAEENRILLTHDEATMPRYAYERVVAGEFMPGLFVVRTNIAIGAAIKELLLLINCSEMNEWKDRVEFLPVT